MKIIILKGGLGNQLFQLSLYLYLINFSPNEDILIDHKTGFLLDYKYKRKYELKRLNKLKKLSTIFIYFDTIICILNKFFPYLKSVFPFKIISDADNYHNLKNIDSKSINILNLRNNIIYDGYFQNYLIVDSVISKLAIILKPYLYQASSRKFSGLYKKINMSVNPVAIGIRFYEETTDPSIHSLNGKQKSSKDFNNIIKKIEEELIDPTFFIFVQEENEFTQDLIFNSTHKFITHENGYIGAWQRLKAQSLCSHHIFNNSTFYWWGCMLSKIFNKKNIESESKIFISDNFIYPEIYNPNWIKF